MLRKWLGVLACIALAGTVPACHQAQPPSDVPFGDRPPAGSQVASAEAASQAGAGTLPGPDRAASRISGSEAHDVPVVSPADGKSYAPAGTIYNAADDTLRILTDRDLAERDDLLATLQTDADFLRLTDVNPLINDGGAVFLADDDPGGSFRVAASDDFPPRWRRIEVRARIGEFDNAIRCRDPQQFVDRTKVGYRSICLDSAEGVADVTVAQRVQGWFILDRYPYARVHLRNFVPDLVVQSVGVKIMDLLAFHRSRFRKSGTKWMLEGVSTVEIGMARPEGQSVHIQAVTLEADGLSLLRVQGPYSMRSAKDLKTVPSKKPLLLRVQVAGDLEPIVFAEGGGVIAALNDGGVEGDVAKGDRIYSARIRAPGGKSDVRRLMVHAFAGHTFASEARDDYDADTWIIPMRVE